MQQTTRRAPRAISPASVTGSHPRQGVPPARLALQIGVLVAGLAVLSLRAHPLGAMPQVEVRFPEAAQAVSPPPAALPSSAAVTRSAGRSLAARSATSSGAPAHQRSVVAGRVTEHDARRVQTGTSSAAPLARAGRTSAQAPVTPPVQTIPRRVTPPALPHTPGRTAATQRRNPHLPAVSALGDRERRALAPNIGFRILAAPSVSVTAIRAELRRVGSPLLYTTWADGKDAAQYMWDAGRVLGVDPALLLAFFLHESHYGTRGMARLTFSVGNIRPLSGQPELNGYRFYRTWEDGVDDTYRLLRRYAHRGAPDVASAVPVWAPSSDNNNVAAYIASVQDAMRRFYLLSMPGATTARSAQSLVAALP